MEIFGIFALGVVCVALIATIKKDSPATALFISITGGIAIIYMILPQMSACIETLLKISSLSSISSQYIEIIVKITGISYLAEFCSSICSDCGQNSIASKIELAAKVFIAAASMPVILGLIKSVNALMP